MIRSALVDIRPFRESPAFTRLYVGSAVSGVGGSLVQFALLLQVWQLTQSPAATGLIALSRALPMLVVTPFGGTLADRCDRRLIMLATGCAGLPGGIVLAWQGVGQWQQVWLLYVVVVVQATIGALGQPAREAALPLLVPRDRLAAAKALTTLSWQATLLVGPALAGLVATNWGLEACYLLGLATAPASLLGVLSLPALRPASSTPRPHLAAMADGVVFVLRSRPLRAAFGLDLALTVLAFPVALLPALNQHLGGTAQSLGIMMSCLGVGGVAAGFTSGIFTRAARPGFAMTVAAGIWCTAVIVLGLSPNPTVAAAAMILWGAADIWFVIPRSTLVQLITPDAQRGRVAAANQLIGGGGPAIGDARAGLLATAIGAGPALVTGALCAASVGVLIVWRLPEARTFHIQDIPGPT